jgi:hypothetical protein
MDLEEVGGHFVAEFHLVERIGAAAWPSRWMAAHWWGVRPSASWKRCRASQRRDVSWRRACCSDGIPHCVLVGLFPLGFRGSWGMSLMTVFGEVIPESF